jgi:hypothetical protein
VLADHGDKVVRTYTDEGVGRERASSGAFGTWRGLGARGRQPAEPEQEAGCSGTLQEYAA